MSYQDVFGNTVVFEIDFLLSSISGKNFTQTLP